MTYTTLNYETPQTQCHLKATAEAISHFLEDWFVANTPADDKNIGVLVIH